jgi:simple sugar transport system permease protein
MSIIIYVYLKYSKQGYEIAVVGESENTAKYVGINVGKVIIRTMIISGVLCGIVGFILVAGIDHSVSETTVGGLGFTAIMASWLAKFNPLVMIVSSAFIAFLNQGSAEISTMFNINSSFPDIVVGIFLFFIIGCEFFLNYKVKRHESTSVTLQAKGVAIK